MVDIIEKLFREDRQTSLYGLKGRGKTNLASVFMSMAVPRGYEVYTNIHFFKYNEIGEAITKGKLPKMKGHHYRKRPQEIHTISRLSELMLGLVEPGKKITILDEAGIHANSSSALSKSTKTIKQLSYIIRHFDSSFMLITQTRGSIPPDLRGVMLDYELEIKKIHGQRLLFVGKRMEERDEKGRICIDFPVVKKFGPIPLSPLPQDGDFPSGFEIDIDLRKTLARLSHDKFSSLDISNGKGREIIQELIDEAGINLDGRKKLLSTGEFGKQVGRTDQTIRAWVKEGKVEFKKVSNRYMIPKSEVARILGE